VVDIAGKAILNDKLGFLNRLCSGQSPLTCQYNLLLELRSFLHWDQVVLLNDPNPWILPLNEQIPFSLPEQCCSTGLWQWDRSDQGDRSLQIQTAAPPQSLKPQSSILDKAWSDWCDAVSHHYQLPNGVLMMIHISLGDAQSHQIPIVILRSCGAFNESEIATLRMIHDALQQIVDQSIILENLLNDSKDDDPKNDDPKDDPKIPDNLDSLPLPMDDRSEPCIQKCLQKLGLTPRQVEVMHLIIKGKELTAIAQELGCTESTVRKHIENLYRRLGVQTRTAAIAHVLETIGLV
jgi:DNA-binding NarL/FixJ family response regulator